MMTMRTMVKKTISLLALTELLILATHFISFTFYINLQVAFLSSFFIIIGSMYAYRKMVHTQVESGVTEEKRDLLETIEDPYELYSEESLPDATDEALDLKTIVEEEKKKIKTLSLKSMKHGARGSASIFRLIPYLFLVLGFIALANNELLSIPIYLPSLLVGIVIGYVSSKEVFV